MQNKRKTERQTCFIRGNIVVGSERTKTCEIHDISDSGARLVGPDIEGLPDFFILAVPRRHMEVSVQVVRRAGSEVGVKFLE